MRFLTAWRQLSPLERRRVGAMLAVIAGLNIAGWLIFALAILPRHFRYSGLGVGMGVAFGLSVAVAFLVGGIEFIGLLSTKLHWHGWFGDAMANFDLNTAGYMIVGLFVVVWAVALAVWKLGHVEARFQDAGCDASP
jgi:hypothetical protein